METYGTEVKRYENACVCICSMLIYEFLCWIWSAGKGFVEAVKNKTEEELDEEVRMESEAVQVKPSHLIHWCLHLVQLNLFFKYKHISI